MKARPRMLPSPPRLLSFDTSTGNQPHGGRERHPRYHETKCSGS